MTFQFVTATLLFVCALSPLAMADRCESLFVDSPTSFTRFDGAPVREVERTKSSFGSENIIWTQKIGAEWTFFWDTEDIPGNVQNGINVLGRQAGPFGFEFKTTAGADSFSIPTVEHANFAVDRFNVENVNHQIPLKLKAVIGLSSPRDFLVDFVNGWISIGVNHFRTYLHDINYHFLAGILMKPALIRSYQRRARLVLEISDRLSEEFPDNPIIKDISESLLKVMSVVIDQTGNWTPLMKKSSLGDDPRLQPQSAAAIIRTLKHQNDYDFLVALTQDILPYTKSFSYYEYNKLISKNAALELRGRTQKNIFENKRLGYQIEESFWVDLVFEQIQKQQSENRLIVGDASVQTILDGLNRFLSTNNHSDLVRLNRF